MNPQDDDDTAREVPSPAVDQRIAVGVSACLLGEHVRHDGSHRRNAFLLEELGSYLRFIGFCPEVNAGLGIPRPTLRLTGGGHAGLRVLEPASGRDHTDLLTGTAFELAEHAATLELSGYVLKSGSPTCGMERVRVYGESGVPRKNGVGLFARALKERLPHLPVEEEGRLCDPRLRESFLLRVFTHHRFCTGVKDQPSLQTLLRFHTAHKLVLLAHDERRARELGRLVANASKEPLEGVLERYEHELFAALSQPASRAHHQNALHHAAGVLKHQLDNVERQQLHAAIVRHGRGEIPLVVPLTLLRVFQARCEQPWLEEQVYLEPHPPELGLYNSI